MWYDFSTKLHENSSVSFQVLSGEAGNHTHRRDDIVIICAIVCKEIG
jgi:hypothetical protein